MKVYLDHAATTPTDESVVESMLPYFSNTFGNANSLNSFGRESAKAVSESRAIVANIIGCSDNEVYFTSSGSEANNWALKGVAFAKAEKGKDIIISSIEHHSVLTTAEYLEKKGFNVIKLPVNENGFVEVETLKKVITDKTILVSVMYVNNEIGTIQPIKELAQVAHEHGALFHSDCVQAMPYLPINVKDLGVDMITISAHKFYGPKGVGALYLRNGVKIEKLILGGGQERSQRAGTTNTPAIVGMAKALQNCIQSQVENNKKIAQIRDHFEQRVENEITNLRFNGSKTNRVCSVSNYSFEYIEGEGILMLLDFEGIAVSSGSACASGSLDPSHVLLSIGVPIELAHGSIRFSFGKHNTIQDADYCVDKLKQSINRLRSMSPLFNLKQGEVKNV